jgi:hypothetical protein
MVAAACVTAHLLFAAITLAATGQLPDWGQYLAYLREFLAGKVGDFNYDVAHWSPGIGVAAGYLASASALVLLVRREPAFVERERASILALVGVTAYGIVLYSYFDNRSTDQTLAHVSLPALLAGALWLALILRSAAAVAIRRAALAFALSVSLLVLAVAASSVREAYPHSALAYAIPGGKSLPSALHRLWHLPPINGFSEDGTALLERYMPGEDRSLVLVTPDLGIETLLRSQRSNLLPLAAPWQDSFVSAERLPALRSAVAGLRAGRRMLIDAAAAKAFAAFRREPEIDPLRGGVTPAKQSLALTLGLSPLQLWALKQIGQRFDLRPIGRRGGMQVVQLEPRR